MNKKIKKILIIGAGRGLEYMLSTAKEIGCEIYCTDRSGDFECKGLCNHFIQCDAQDIERIEEYYKSTQPLGIISPGYHGLHTAACLVSKFKKWGSGPDAVRKVMDKKILRKYMNGGIRFETDYRITANLAELEKAIIELLYPVIVKDASANCGSRNIRVLKNDNDYLNFKANYNADSAGELLVERYYDWDTFGMSGIMNEGRLIYHHFFREFNRDKLYPTEYEISCIDDGMQEPLNQMITNDIAEYLNKLDYCNGPIDVDLLVSPSGDEYRIIEIDPLLEGDMLIEHIDLCTGMNMDKALLSLAVQEECPQLCKKPRGYAVIKFFKGMNEKKEMIDLINNDNTIKKSLHRLYVNDKPAPEENTARDKWRYGYSSFLFYDKGDLLYFRKLIKGGDDVQRRQDKRTFKEVQ